MSALAWHIERPTDEPSAASRSAERGTATGGVRLILRLEGLAVFAAAVALYAHAGLSWPAFIVFLLAPDLSMAAYLAGPRAGAAGYNLATPTRSRSASRLPDCSPQFRQLPPPD